ncbi:MAG: dimethyladenosine transferase, rRNA (adenine1518-N6/adenine1519-N6)-dimethyltransferase [Candidatus Parcubacteria bacterium]|jgi:16S rRNA (adenine1518-N6/adenine1519-N6)-dimethyltransferase
MSMKKRGTRLGQHFLTGQWAAKKLADAIAVRPNETILEIGPGKGALTKELLRTGGRVVAVEKDKRLVEELEQTFKNEIDRGRLVLAAADIRDLDGKESDLGAYVVAANIPYYITGDIIRYFLTANCQPRAMALLVQKEVADRIVARNGKESVLSLSVKAYGTPKIVARVSKGNFNPQPSVDSAILLITDISRDFFNDASEEEFFAVVKAGFSSKRKILRGNLKKRFGDAPKWLGNTDRAEELDLQTWKRLARELALAH